ncbi:MAG: PspC domain-containing protein [Rubricoccaceae bacterium]
MATRERQRPSFQEDDVTQEEIEAFLYEQEAESDTERPPGEGFWNVQTTAGIALLLVGALYVAETIGLLPLGLSLTAWAQTLPWLAGALILLTGLGGFSRSRRRRERARARAAKARARAARARDGSSAYARAERLYAQADRLYNKTREAASRAYTRGGRHAERRLAKNTRDKKISGVAGGIARYLGLDPTLVRVLFVLGTIFGSGAAIVLYVVLAFVLPRDESDGGNGAGRPFEEGSTIRVVND